MKTKYGIQLPIGSPNKELSLKSLGILETAIEEGREISFSYNGESVTAKPSRTFFKECRLHFVATGSGFIRAFRFGEIDVNEGKGIQFTIIEEGKEA